MKRRPDAEVLTRVRAKELRFGRVPETKVSFEGEPAYESSSQVERENLPEEVEPGVTYRDVEVGWAARARAKMPERELEQEEEDPERED